MKQVIFLDWGNYKPKLFCRDENTNECSIDISKDQELNFKLADCRCIGPSFDEPCPHSSEDGPQCKDCAPFGCYPCVICNGTECLLPKKRLKCSKTPYTIYLTSFGDIVKVGVSQRARLMQRWLEQGAEFGCEIKVVRDGLLARKLENLIGKIKGVSMAVRHNKKRSNEPKKDVFETKIEDIVEKFQWVSKKPQIYDLTGFYPKLPEKEPILQDLKGTSGGVRGHLLLLNNEIIDLKKLVGWRLEQIFLS
jgi:hypothetical protein